MGADGIEMKKLSFLALLAAFVISLAGCNTVKGVGQDVSSVGQGIDNVATDVQKQM